MNTLKNIVVVSLLVPVWASLWLAAAITKPKGCQCRLCGRVPA